MKRAIIVVVMIFLTGCVGTRTQRAVIDPTLAEGERIKQSEIAMRSLHEDMMRLNRIVLPVRRGGASICGDEKIHHTGAIIVNDKNIPEELRGAAKSIYGIDEQARVVQLIDGFPAYGRLKEGDVVLSINGDKHGKHAYDKEIADLEILRGVEKIKLSIPTVEICRFHHYAQLSDAVNAFADGEKVVITRGMMRFAATDEELALVVGHELAHNAMGHVRAKSINAIPGVFLDVLVAAMTRGLITKTGATDVYSQDFEAEADYVGVYMMALAGYDYSNAANFWRRMAANHPGSIKTDHAATHPPTPERFLAIEQTVAEINEKKAKGQPLTPNLGPRPLLTAAPIDKEKAKKNWSSDSP